MTIEQNQLDTVTRSQEALNRAAGYEQHLAGRVATLKGRIETASASRVAAAIGATNTEPQADPESLRTELATVTKQHALATKARETIKAEHARHVGDLNALFGSSAASRANLKDAHAARDAAGAAAAASKAILDRGNAHLAALDAKLAQEREVETDRDWLAISRLQSALQSGEASTEATEHVQRNSVALDEDVRTARLTVDRLTADHTARLADLAAADKAVHAAADDVLVAEAEVVARELQMLETRTAVLRRRLTSFTERHPTGYVPSAHPVPPARQTPGGWFVRDANAYAAPPKVRQTPVIMEALTPPASRLDRSGPYAINWTAETEGWTRFASALVVDAHAKPSFAPAPSYPPQPASRAA